MGKIRHYGIGLVAALAIAATATAGDASKPPARLSKVVRTIEANAGTYRKVDLDLDFPHTYFLAGPELKKCLSWPCAENGQENEILEWYFDHGKPLLLVQTVRLYKMHEYRFGPEIDCQWTNRYEWVDGKIARFTSTAPPRTNPRRMSWREISEELSYIAEEAAVARKRAAKPR